MTLGDAGLEQGGVDDVRGSISKLVQTLAAMPADASALAHTLKGSARAIGAFAVADAAARLEAAIARGFDASAALAELGETVAQRAQRWIRSDRAAAARACVRDRELIGSDRSVDIGFHQLNGNEMSILKTLYGFNGTTLTNGARAAFRGDLDDNPQGKLDRNDMTSNGVSADHRTKIRSRFGFYFDRFDVREKS